VQATYEPPDVAPAQGEHTCPRNLVRRQEAQDVLEDAVWLGAEPVRHHHFLGPGLLSHSLEQVVSAGRFGLWKQKVGTEMSGRRYTESKALTLQRRSAPLTLAVLVSAADGEAGARRM
jgi:hypothetical protein